MAAAPTYMHLFSDILALFYGAQAAVRGLNRHAYQPVTVSRGSAVFRPQPQARQIRTASRHLLQATVMPPASNHAVTG